MGIFGSRIGPTGRKRYKYGVTGYPMNKGKGARPLTHSKGHGYGREAGDTAFGVIGVRQAKRSIQKKFPHTRKKFYVYNEDKHKYWKRT